MGLSIAELESQSSECLPAREVMTLLANGPSGRCVGDASASDQSSSGLIAFNVDGGNAGIGNGNNVCLSDVLDVNGNDVANDVLNDNLDNADVLNDVVDTEDVLSPVTNITDTIDAEDVLNTVVAHNLAHNG